VSKPLLALVLVFFSCNIGVRQGENLSPILFALFLNDLKAFLSVHSSDLKLPSKLVQDLNFEDVEHFVNLFLLLYADDTVLLAESPENMQEILHALKSYCDAFGLHINTLKTKCVIFSRGKIRKLPKLLYGDNNIEIVWDYKYLGTRAYLKSYNSIIITLYVHNPLSLYVSLVITFL
jgi:hypothetical protein